MRAALATSDVIEVIFILMVMLVYAIVFVMRL